MGWRRRLWFLVSVVSCFCSCRPFSFVFVASLAARAVRLLHSTPCCSRQALPGGQNSSSCYGTDRALMFGCSAAIPMLQRWRCGRFCPAELALAACKTLAIGLCLKKRVFAVRSSRETCSKSPRSKVGIHRSVSTTLECADQTKTTAQGAPPRLQPTPPGRRTLSPARVRSKICLDA